jgi:PAS domain S-box-containing protein
MVIMTGTMWRRARHFWKAVTLRVTLVLIAVCTSSHCLIASSSNFQETKRVVVLYPESDGRPGNARVDRGIRAELQSYTAEPVEIYNEYLDLSRFSDDRSQQLIADFLRQRYADRKIDVVIPGLGHALDFVLKYRSQVFSEVPVGFCAVEQSEIAARRLAPDVIGVPMQFDLASTLDEALRLHPKTRHVYVVAGVANYDAAWEAEARRLFRPYEDKREFVYLSGLTMHELLSRAANLPKHSIIYYLHVFQDGAGRILVPAEVVEQLAAVANALIYGHVDSFIGRGIVGGRTMSFENSGRIAGRLALRILNGERPESIGVSEPGENAYEFDWRQLRSWGIDESHLPPGSIVHFKQPSFWDLYKWHTVAVFSLVIVQALLIAGLLVQRAKRGQAEQRFREALEGATNGTIMIGQDGRLLLANSHVAQLFGYCEKELLGQPVELLVPERFRSNHPGRLAQFFAAPKQRLIGAGRHLFGRRKDGSEFPVEIGLNPIETDAGLVVVATIIDITERKLAEDSLRESEARFRLMADAAPVLVWMSGHDKRCTYFNTPWLEFTGWPIEQQLGDGWSEGVHPDDLMRCLDVYTSHFDARQPFEMEYRLRRHDGEYRWVMDRGVPRFSSDKTFAGYIGACIDVTDRKRAEEELLSSYRRQRDLAGQLLTAQESERRRIARELHDDLSQRLALLAVEIELLAQRPPPSAEQTRQRLAQFAARVKELSTSVHDLSHQLHPSKLEQLGLVAAVRSLCKELTDGGRLPIEFTHKDVPDRIPEDAALCVYRIVQEALSNVIKHSGARHAGVDLSSIDGTVVLRIVDDGTGFDPGKVHALRGLGLVNMRERLHLVNGEIAIDSKPSGGTRIRVSVPVNAGGS